MPIRHPVKRTYSPGYTSNDDPNLSFPGRVARKVGGYAIRGTRTRSPTHPGGYGEREFTMAPGFVGFRPPKRTLNSTGRDREKEKRQPPGGTDRSPPPPGYARETTRHQQHRYTTAVTICYVRTPLHGTLPKEQHKPCAEPPRGALAIAFARALAYATSKRHDVEHRDPVPSYAKRVNSPNLKTCQFSRPKLIMQIATFKTLKSQNLKRVSAKHAHARICIRLCANAFMRSTQTTHCKRCNLQRRMSTIFKYLPLLI